MRYMLLLALASCSFVVAESPHPPPGPTKCNRELTPIVVDVAAALGSVLAFGIAGLEHGGRYDTGVPLASAGLFGASSIYGAITINDCRSEHEKRPAWSLHDMPAVL